MKYIVVTGGVMSGLGKGITIASIGRNLKNKGYKVTAIKIDPYINIDAGTMSPYQHCIKWWFCSCGWYLNTSWSSSLNSSVYILWLYHLTCLWVNKNSLYNRCWCLFFSTTMCRHHATCSCYANYSY